MDVSSCQKDRVIQTFPWIFVVIFFVFGFCTSVLGCLCINNESFVKFIPLILAIIFEMILAALVSLLKSYHTNYLHSELFDSLKCYKRGAMTTAPYTRPVDFDELNLRSMNYVQTTYNCCGVNSYEDWIRIYNAVPKSCCAHMKTCNLQIVKQKIGCYAVVKADVYSNWNAMIMFIIIFICIKLIMLIMYKCSEIARFTDEQIELEKYENVFDEK